MHRYLWSVVLVALTVALSVGVATVSANPGQVEKGLDCLVTDANGVNYGDPTCTFHLVVKTDAAGNVVFVQYQDHGQLPPGAALPTQALHAEIFVACGGCIFEGTYKYVVTPSGEYKSKGPFKKTECAGGGGLHGPPPLTRSRNWKRKRGRACRVLAADHVRGRHDRRPL